MVQKCNGFVVAILRNNARFEDGMTVITSVLVMRVRSHYQATSTFGVWMQNQYEAIWIDSRNKHALLRFNIGRVSMIHAYWLHARWKYTHHPGKVDHACAWYIPSLQRKTFAFFTSYIIPLITVDGGEKRTRMSWWTVRRSCQIEEAVSFHGTVWYAMLARIKQEYMQTKPFMANNALCTKVL